MSHESRDLVQKIAAHLAAHPKTTLQIAADRLGISGQEIEDALRDQEGVSFEEFVANRRLEQAFQQLGERSPAADGPYEVIRARRRVLIPKTTVKYQVHGFLFRKSEYSNQCPLVDLSSEGLAFLSDEAPKPPKSVSLLLKFPGGESALRVEGRVVYLVATGIAGYRYRVGVKFLPFAHERGCNDPKTLDILHNLEKTYDS